MGISLAFFVRFVGGLFGVWSRGQIVLLFAARESSPVGASRAAVAAVVLLRFAWAPIAMAFVLVGVTSPGATLGVVVLAVILGAAALHAKLSGRPF